MIIWLASYPRSGNTLLRTLLNQCFGVSTFSDELTIYSKSNWKSRGIGDEILPTDWDTFYENNNAASSEVNFVKTHKGPRDEQPAIYIYRDGRMALQSYVDLHRTRIKAKPIKSMMDLVLGDDYYGHWSSHYQSWAQRKSPTLFLRFEDLVNASPHLIERIAAFIKMEPISKEWENPLQRLHQDDPVFFRTGRIHWEPTKDWTKKIDQIFNYIHGELLVKLGYSNQEMVGAAIAELCEIDKEILDITANLAQRCASLQSHCDERLRVINTLSRAVEANLDISNK
jgi:hypothetical protein